MAGAGKARFFTMDTYDQESLFSASGGTASGASASAKDAFGCCSRYSACSDAKACLIPHLDCSKNCIYRKSLEQGHIFYGKNADKYNAAVYQSFVDNFKSLSPDCANLLRGILYYAFVKKRGIKLIMLADSPQIPTLDQSGFLSQVNHPDKVVKKCSVSAMVNACGDLIETANEWAKSKVKPEVWKRRKSIRQELPGVKILRDELSTWNIQYGPEAMKKLTEGISFGDLDLYKTLELEEFFKDCIYNEDTSFPLDTLENDPRFLNQ